MDSEKMVQTFPSSYGKDTPEEMTAAIKDKMVAKAIFGKIGSQTFKVNHIRTLPRFAQSQVALEDQLELARGVLNQIGLYDAADYLKRRKHNAR